MMRDSFRSWTPNEDDFCSCGGVYSRRRVKGRRWCVYCEHPKQEIEVQVRMPGGQTGWLIIHALRDLLDERDAS